MAKNQDTPLSDCHFEICDLEKSLMHEALELDPRSLKDFRATQFWHSTMLADLTSGITACKKQQTFVKSLLINLGFWFIGTLMLAWPGMFVAGWLVLGAAFIMFHMFKNLLGINKNLEKLEKRIQYPFHKLDMYAYYVSMYMVMMSEIREKLDMLEKEYHITITEEEV